MLDLAQVNRSWTLFLDRDGVINHDKSPYTLNEKEFDFYDEVPASIRKLNDIFNRIVIVTNQRGVGRALMTEADLLGIHNKMLLGITQLGGRIDKIYYCTSADSNHPDRKPNAGMATQALKEFNDIDASRAIMVGNNLSDMEFGRNAGFYTVLVHTTGTRVNLPHPLVDLQYDTLPDFTRDLERKISRD